MELGLSLGMADMASKPPFVFMENTHELTTNKTLKFSMGLSMDHEEDDDENASSINGGDKPIQLDLLPNTPVSRNGSSEAGCSEQMMVGRGLDVNRLPAAEGDDGPAESSPNSGGERTSSRDCDDDENGSSRKKLRLSKEQSVFLEESFKEHNTLNPKQKIALAKQLNLRPRQVEVWFQNRRARTKLKQTEVDCEYLKRCCETLTEENRRLHRELQDLRALKNSNPLYMQLPATTLTMCPSCERIATASTTSSAATPATTITTNSGDPLTKSTGLRLSLTR